MYTDLAEIYERGGHREPEFARGRARRRVRKLIDEFYPKEAMSAAATPKK